ncbi:MAG: cytochrome P450 [Aridibacter famidurans]|nr:cytochrome P450 [Aridibacter famidurans]
MSQNGDRLPPGLAPGIFGGHFFRYRKRPTEFLREMAALGDVTHMQLFRMPAYLLNHPDLARDLLVNSNSKFVKGRALQRAKMLLGEGLLTSEGEAHLRQRRMIQPAFHKDRIASYAQTMSGEAVRIRKEWKNGSTLDMDREMMRLTLRIVGRTLFGVDVDGDAEEVGAAMTDLIESFDFLLIPFSEHLEKLPIPPANRCRRAIATLDRVIYGFIEERRMDLSDEGDLLSMLLLARDEDDGGVMTDKQVRDEAITLFLAGHETTANALTFTWYLLSQNPDAESRLHDEIDSVLGGRAPSFEDIPDLKFTEAVLAESMRLFPPAWAVGRLAAEEHEFGGYNVPKGALVLISPFVMHRDERFWERPDDFIPERWETQSVKEASRKFIYLPFSRGVRSCIGEGFAWTEGILAIAAIARKWRFRLAEGQKLGLKPLMTLRPAYGMRMVAEKRKRE